MIFLWFIVQNYFLIFIWASKAENKINSLSHAPASWRSWVTSTKLSHIYQSFQLCTQHRHNFLSSKIKLHFIYFKTWYCLKYSPSKFFEINTQLIFLLSQWGLRAYQLPFSRKSSRFQIVQEDKPWIDLEYYCIYSLRIWFRSFTRKRRESDIVWKWYQREYPTEPAHSPDSFCRLQAEYRSKFWIASVHIPSKHFQTAIGQ